jgi:hypothetical protein
LKAPHNSKSFVFRIHTCLSFRGIDFAQHTLRVPEVIENHSLQSGSDCAGQTRRLGLMRNLSRQIRRADQLSQGAKMTTRKTTKKKTTKEKDSPTKTVSKRSAKKSGVTKKRAGKKARKASSSPGIFGRVTRVAGKVLIGAVAGAAKGAVAGAAEAGSEATGISQTSNVETKEKSKK